jgi:predicted lysophospholipase L1 biosynthesis ABC-type transport system permease subunit
MQADSQAVQDVQVWRMLGTTTSTTIENYYHREMILASCIGNLYAKPGKGNKNIVTIVSVYTIPL